MTKLINLTQLNSNDLLLIDPKICDIEKLNKKSQQIRELNKLGLSNKNIALICDVTEVYVQSVINYTLKNNNRIAIPIDIQQQIGGDLKDYKNITDMVKILSEKTQLSNKEIALYCGTNEEYVGDIIYRLK